MFLPRFPSATSCTSNVLRVTVRFPSTKLHFHMILYDFLLQSYISKTPYDTVRFLDELCYREDAKYDCGYVPVNPTISYDFTVKFV